MVRSSRMFGQAAFLVIAAVAAVAGAAQQRPTAVLTLEPATTLPSLPVAFMVTIANPADQPVTIWDVMTLKVTTANGTFAAKGLNGRTNVNLPQDVVDP